MDRSTSSQSLWSKEQDPRCVLVSVHTNHSWDSWRWRQGTYQQSWQNRWVRYRSHWRTLCQSYQPSFADGIYDPAQVSWFSSRRMLHDVHKAPKHRLQNTLAVESTAEKASWKQWIRRKQNWGRLQRSQCKTFCCLWCWPKLCQGCIPHHPSRGGLSVTHDLTSLKNQAGCHSSHCRLNYPFV